MFGFRKQKRVNPVPGTISIDLTPEKEVELIQTFLEKKFKTKFEKRIKVEGYLDDLQYKLVLENYRTRKSYGDNAVAVWGGNSKSVFDISKEFVSNYWWRIDKYLCKDQDQKFDSFDKYSYDDCLKTAVANSREEFLLKAEAAGLI